MKNKKILFFFVFLFLFGNNPLFSLHSYSDFSFSMRLKDVALITKKRGVYLGYERGLYDVMEFGMEFQRKKLGIRKLSNHACSFGFNYNIRHNVLGYSMSYWHLKGIYGLTYGGDVFYFTDFTYSDAGISPAIGFRFSGFHLQTGYKLLIAGAKNVECNRFFIRLRFTLNKKTDRDLRW